MVTEGGAGEEGGCRGKGGCGNGEGEARCAVGDVTGLVEVLGVVGGSDVEGGEGQDGFVGGGAVEVGAEGGGDNGVVFRFFVDCVGV